MDTETIEAVSTVAVVTRSSTGAAYSLHDSPLWALRRPRFEAALAAPSNDGQADIVVVSNAYTKNTPGIMCLEDGINGQSGVRVFGAAAGKWVRTRRVWNQHAYHVTNAREDSTDSPSSRGGPVVVRAAASRRS